MDQASHVCRHLLDAAGSSPVDGCAAARRGGALADDRVDLKANVVDLALIDEIDELIEAYRMVREAHKLRQPEEHQKQQQNQPRTAKQVRRWPR